ncbi:MAG: DUF5009 domain-containing protein [Acidobacteria bacterium]|nr:DUF5009 domain-containing protein [Acidobacteriota bacterium]
MSSPTETRVRNIAVDVYRGFVMLLMMAEVLRLSAVARAYPDSAFWSFLSYHQSHVQWAGCSLHDLIQPSFSFLVGVALPYSIASRLAKGATFPKMLLHALWRAFLLAAMGIFLRSTGSAQTNFTFEDTLTQIGLGYPFLFCLGFVKPRWQWTALGAILFGYWLAWALWPVPNGGCVPPDGTSANVFVQNYTGFMAHWNKNCNLGASFDLWFLNLFPRAKVFVANGGGYLTLSFIPTLGTMLLGAIAGRWLKNSAPQIPLKRFCIAGAAGIAAGLALHFLGICPVVKRIWTPSWTLFSGGMCFLLLAGFEWLVELRGFRKPFFPLVVVGMNSIAAYLIAHLFEGFIASSFRIHLGVNAFAVFGTGLQPLLGGAMVLLVMWWMLYWMYQRKVFLRV